MIFSAEFLSYLIYGALGWCIITSTALIILLLKEWKKGNLW